MCTRREFGAAAVLVIAMGCLVATAQGDLEARIAKAPRLKVENVAAPIRSARGGRTLLVPNPDGKTYDILVRYYDTYWGPHTTFIIDTATGEVTTHRVPHALYGWGRLGPGGKYYGHLLGTKKGKVLWCYDPATNKITNVAEGLPAAGGEVHPVTVGTDGKIYGGGSGGDHQAAAYMYDPETGKVTDFGTLGPSHSPQPCWGYSIAADDEYIYMASGKIPWYLVAKNKKTGEEMVLLTAKGARDYIAAIQGRHGCTAMLRRAGVRPDRRYWLYRGKAIEIKDPKEKPPWPVPAETKPLYPPPPKPEIWMGKAIPKADGKAEIWYRSAEAKKKWPGPLPPGVEPAERGWHIVKLQVETFPAPIMRVTALPDGRVTGSGQSYMGNFIYDPKTGKAEHLGRLPLSHYCTTVLDGMVYMSGYPSSALYRFDPNKPWTVEVSATPGVPPLPPQHPDSNPRRLCYLAHHGSGCHKMWTACNGADGRAYFGGRWYRNGEQGGLGWWDPKTQKAGGMREAFRNYQIMRITPVARGRYIAISTKTCRDQERGVPPPKEAKIFVFDTRQGRIINSFVPVPGADQTGHIVGVGGNTVLGITYDPSDRTREVKPDEVVEYIKGNEKAYGLLDRNSILYKADAVSGKVLWTKKIPYPVGFRTNENFANQDGFDFRLGPDGKVWTFTGARFCPVNPKKKWHYSYTNCRIVEDPKAPGGFRLEGMNVTLVRIDPENGAIEVVGQLDRGGEMAFVGRDLYLSGGCKYLTQMNMYLRRIRNVVPEP